VSSNSYNPTSWSIGFNQIVSSAVVAQVAEDFLRGDRLCGSRGSDTIPCRSASITSCLASDRCGSHLTRQRRAGVRRDLQELAPLSVGEFKNLVKKTEPTLPNVLAVRPRTILFDSAHPNPALDSPVAGLEHDHLRHGARGDRGHLPSWRTLREIPACTANAGFPGTRLVTRSPRDTRLVGKIHIWVKPVNTNSKSGAFRLLATTKAHRRGQAQITPCLFTLPVRRAMPAAPLG